MHDDDDLAFGSLELLLDNRREQKSREELQNEKIESARQMTDQARLALTSLAPEAVMVIAMRLTGAPAEGGQGSLKAGEFPIDENGRPVTRERENAAWELLSRIGIPRLRATAIAASFAAFTEAPAPGSPGREKEVGEEGEVREVDSATVDAQIQAFLDGARAAAEMREDDD